MELWILHLTAIGVCSVEDWKEKQISLWKIFIYGGTVLLIEAGKAALGERNFSDLWIKIMCGSLPGLFFLLLSKATREQIGYGDGLLLLILGSSLGFWKVLEVLSAALCMVFFRAVYLLLCHRKKERIAFIPFLFLSILGGAVCFWGN